MLCRFGGALLRRRWFESIAQVQGPTRCCLRSWLPACKALLRPGYGLGQQGNAGYPTWHASRTDHGSEQRRAEAAPTPHDGTVKPKPTSFGPKEKRHGRKRYLRLHQQLSEVGEGGPHVCQMMA